MSRLACKWKAKTFAKDDDLLLNIIIRAQKLLTYFQWFQLAEKVLSQFFLANVTLWGSHTNAAWVARASYKHYSSLSQLSFFLYSHTRQQQLPALCIAAHLCIVLVVSSSPIIVARRNFPSSLGCCCCVYNTVAIHPSSHPSTAVVMLG